MVEHLGRCVAQHEELRRMSALQEEDAGDLENLAPGNAQVLNVISNGMLHCPGGNDVGDTKVVKYKHITDADTDFSTDGLDESCIYISQCMSHFRMISQKNLRI